MAGSRGAVRRADLIDAERYFKPSNADRYSFLYGYYRLDDTASDRQDVQVRETEAQGEPSASPEPWEPMARKEAGKEPVRYWRITTWRPNAEENVANRPDWYHTAASYLGDRRAYAVPNGFAKPLKPPLIPWSRMWPFLRAALGRMVGQDALDVDAVIRDLARCRPLSRLPYKQKRGWAPVWQLILDCDRRLAPLWDDMTQLCDQLVKLRGRYGGTILLFRDGPLGPCRELGADRQPVGAYPFPEPDTPILVLSDLGLTDPTGVRNTQWCQFGRKLQRAGFQPVVLTLAPRRLWDAETATLWRMYVWDRGAKLPRTTADPINRGELRHVGEKEYIRGADTLLTILAPCVRVEPALLRAARYLTPKAHTDVAVEIAVWNHEDVRSDLICFTYKPDKIGMYRRQFRDRTEQLDLPRLLKRHHRALSPLTLAEELFHWGMLTGDAECVTTAEQSLCRYFKTIEDEYSVERSLLPAFKEWFLGWVRRTMTDQWSSSDVLCAAYLRTVLDQARNQEQIELHGISLEKYTWLLERTEPRRWTLLQRGMNRIEALPTLSDDLCPLGAVSNSLNLFGLETVVNAETHSVAVGVTPDGTVSLQLGDAGRIRLVTDQETLELEVDLNFPWAKRRDRGRNESGLYLTTLAGRWLYWNNPGRYQVNLKGRNATVDIPHGFWWDATEYLDWRRSTFANLDWADSCGADEYGIYAEFSVGSVRQRLRWIRPGTFLMGSPESEPERSDNEKQHEVIITRGYWLADTACTQELWQAVMDNNPSNFKGNTRPVENVGWDDCQEFLTRLNKRAPKLKPRLPTEAEWEYACRAGTEGPFSFGDNITPAQVNYDGNYPYLDGAKGEYRKETVPVKSLPGNAWGLFEMHGNVRDWCQDWFGDYPDVTAIDPIGPAEGSLRVLRGGGWISGARYCRSAYRLCHSPGDRYVSFGFRLARGQ